MAQGLASSDAKNFAGYDSSERARYATMGAAYDAYPPGLHRDADTALVAEKIVARYGQLAECTDEQRTRLTGAELTKKQDGAQDSLG